MPYPLQLATSLSSDAQYVKEGTTDSPLALTDLETGKVGIGTTDLSQTLVVKGDTLIEGHDWGSGEDAVLYLGDTSHYIKSVWGDGVKIGTYQAPDVIVIKETSGNIGIGTTDPLGRLHIVKNTSSIIDETDYALKIEDATSESVVGLLIGVSSGDDVSIIQSFDPGTGWDERPLALMPNGGKLGIGTASPGANVLVMEVSKSVTSVDNDPPENHAIKFSTTMNAHTSGYTLNATTISPVFGSAYPDQTTKNCLYIAPAHTSNFKKIKGINIYMENGDSNSDAIFIDANGAANGVNCSCGGTGTAITGKGEGAGATGGYFEAANVNYFALQTGTGKVCFEGSVGIGTTSPGAKLEVNGDIKAGGQIFIDSNGYLKPVSSSDASAPNNSIYINSTSGKLTFKDGGGTANPLY
ncbi:MAG: hypothetical protein JXB18_11420 [Sedimentisphaerales bacterium]|nr:hypothetical protein [Sedimentisphaerales bacterium]